MKKGSWVKNIKTQTQAWLAADEILNWDKLEVVTASGKVYWKKSNVVAI